MGIESVPLPTGEGLLGTETVPLPTGEGLLGTESVPLPMEGERLTQKMGCVIIWVAFGES